MIEKQIRFSTKTDVFKVLFTELNSAIALAIVRFEFPALSILAFFACFNRPSPSFWIEGTPAYLAHLLSLKNDDLGALKMA